MKRNLKVLRGARGLPGLSAYGLWLSQGNQGDLEKFFLSISSNREVLYQHSGGQCVAPGAAVQLQHRLGSFLPGRYIVQYMLCAYDGIFSIYVDGMENTFARYRAHDFLNGLCIVQIMQENAVVTIQNLTNQCVQLQGHHGCVDAYLWARLID